jgi:putative transcriptional regulator
LFVTSVHLMIKPTSYSRNPTEQIMIEVRIDKLLEKQERTFYWLAKETGISHSTLWRLKKGKALGINFETLEKLCSALECEPGQLFAINNNKSAIKRRKKKT